ncbi:hypothetical protein [Paraburkholderia adhaesiva]|uniref:hypothetical protein n=1 Tax=Paraburkholderia adhaesiva TaxID=2883244 RepID=UPI001F274BEB|nr:hypothetical protein [Paraburkholderia adhaesiva]
MKVILKIGLGGYGAVPVVKEPGEVLEALKAHGMVVPHHYVEVVEYEGPEGPVAEGVVVAEVKGAHHEAIYAVAEELHEACIAVGYLLGGALIGGELIGPDAVAWGEFNPEFFHIPEELAVA